MKATFCKKTLGSTTVNILGLWTTSVGHFQHWQPPQFANRIPTMHSGIQEGKMSLLLP